MSIETAEAVWSEFEKAKLIQPKSYDKKLVAELAVTLGLDPKKPFEAELASSALTAKDLLRALLHALEPLTDMLKDLLELYSDIDARSADDDSLIIEYEFDKGHPVDLLLSDFRHDVTELIEVVRPLTRLEVTQAALLTFPYPHAVRNLAANPRMETWRRRFVEDSEYIDFPRQSSTANRELDTAILRTEAVISAILQATLRTDSNHKDFVEGDSNDYKERRELAIVRSDKWVASAVIGIDDALRDPSLSQQAITDKLNGWVDQFSSFSASETVLMSVAQSLLALPMWGKRHALYSAWLLTQVHSAVDGNLAYIVKENRLSFPFGGAHIATLETVEGPLEFWTELRSDLHKPRGKNRTNGIQPDYRFVADLTDRVNTTPLAIEAKQYAKSTKRVHAEAIDDYTRGLPNGKVILAAYGPVSKNVLDSIPQTQADRAIVIRHLKPGAVHAEEEFAHAVADALPAFRPSVPPYPLTITLTWNPAVRDLDLHGFITASGLQLWWENLREGDVTLSPDSFNGDPQTLTLGAIPAQTLSVWVNVYEGGSLVKAQPRIIISTADKTVTLEPSAPPAGAKTWHVLDVLPDGQLDIVDSYGPLPR